MNPRMSVVQIAAVEGLFLGSGFFISKTKILTCRHVLGTKQKNLSASDIVVKWLGDERRVDQCETHPDRDAVCLIIARPFSLNPEIIVWALDAPSEGSEVQIFGFNKPEVYGFEDLTRHVRGYAAQHDLGVLDHPVLRGFSGSPACIDNAFVGMVVATDKDRTFLIPATALRVFALKEKPLQPFEAAGQPLLCKYQNETFLVKDFDGNWFKFPRSYPTFKLSDTKEELKNITSWKIVHSSVENFYRVYNDFHTEIIRWEQAKDLDHPYSEMQRSNAQRRLKSIRPQFEDFSEQLKSLPSSIIENEMISILSMLPTCHEALMQSIGAADSHQIDYVFEFSERIADWLLHTLHIADLIIELYFRQKENEGENR